MDQTTDLSVLINESKTPAYALLLSHGAGAPMQHHFMEDVANEIANRNGNVVRFNFPYITAGRKAPGSPKPNIAAIGAMVEYMKDKYPELPLFLSGKSYGGRMSSHWVSENEESKVDGLIYFGFPLHAPGRDSKDRAAHLFDLETPQLFIQGTNDKLANFNMITEVANTCKKATIVEIKSGDHSFKVPKREGVSQEEIITILAESADSWALKQKKS